MIRLHIFSGTTAFVIHRAQELSGLNHSLIRPRPLPIPWQGVRLFLADLQQRLAPEDFDRAKKEDAATLGLIWPQDEGISDPTQGVDPLGFLSHNGHIQKPLSVAVTKLLRKLMDNQPWFLTITQTANLDLESLAVFRAMLHTLPQFHMVLGAPPDEEPPDIAGRVHLRQVRAHLVQLEAHDFTRFQKQESEDNPPPPAPAPPYPLAHTPEYRLNQQFTQGSPVNTSQALALVERAFRCFSFESVTVLGMGCTRLDLNPRQAAQLHRLIATAAYNTQVQSMGDLDLAAFLQHHYQQAFDLETDPIVKAHLYYRLLINAGRRQGDTDEALILSNQGLDLIEDRREPLARFTTAWLLNGRAYVLARRKDLDGALADCERALELLNQVGDLGPIQGEVSMSRAVIIDNLGRLNLYAGRSEEGIRRQKQLAQLERDEISGLNISFNRWVEFARAEHQLEEAREQAQRGYDHAQTNNLPLILDHFAMELGDLHYRLGDCDKAAHYFTVCRPIRERVGQTDDKLKPAVNLALTKGRMGRHQQAVVDFQSILTQIKDPGAQAQTLAEIAYHQAAAGNHDENLVNTAIETAANHGDQGVLMRVAARIGDLCILIRQPENAMQAFASALDIAQADPDTGDPVAVWNAHLGMAKCTGNPNHLRPTLTGLNDALEDAHTWWELNTLCRIWRNALTHLPANHALRQDPQISRDLGLLVTAARQRQDIPVEMVDFIARFADGA